MPKSSKPESEHERILALEEAFESLAFMHAPQAVATEFVPGHLGVGGVHAIQRGACLYADKEYSSGSVVCQAGKKYVCSSGVWRKVQPVEAC